MQRIQVQFPALISGSPIITLNCSSKGVFCLPWAPELTCTYHQNFQPNCELAADRVLQLRVAFGIRLPEFNPCLCLLVALLGLNFFTCISVTLARIQSHQLQSAFFCIAISECPDCSIWAVSIQGNLTPGRPEVLLLTAAHVRRESSIVANYKSTLLYPQGLGLIA